MIVTAQITTRGWRVFSIATLGGLLAFAAAGCSDDANSEARTSAAKLGGASESDLPPDLRGLGLKLTLDDEFDVASISDDGVANGTLWTNHLHWLSPRRDLVSVSNGHLLMRLDPNDSWASHIVSTNADGQGFAQKFGYYEVDYKIPDAPGLWPSFWLINDSVANQSRPAPEFDILEGQTSHPNAWMTTLHRDTGGNDQTNNDTAGWGSVFHELDHKLIGSSHRFGMLWDPSSPNIVFYFDGAPIQSVPKFDTTDDKLVNVIVGFGFGDMLGDNFPNASTWDSVAEVDYVRVWQFPGQPNYGTCAGPNCDGASTPPPPPPPPPPDQPSTPDEPSTPNTGGPEGARVAALVAAHSDQCADVAGVSMDDGAPVQQWPCHGGANQRWRLEPKGGGRYQIVSESSGKCLDVTGARTANGTRLQQWGCHGGDNQLWTLDDDGSGEVALVSVASGRCADVEAVSEDAGARLQIWDCHGGPNQRFTMK